MPEAGAPSGTFTVLTYNVAGLFAPLSGSAPEINQPQISPLLNDFDLVLVQEDFCYPELLAADADFPYVSEPSFTPACNRPDRVGDGLNRFSIFPFTDFERTAWEQCSGTTDCASDCATQKGFTYARHSLDPGNPDADVDVYNLHLDASRCRGDIEARGLQVEQLVEFARATSEGRAMLVAGDTNLNLEVLGNEQIYRILREALALSDACRSVECGEETVDRIFFRSSERLSLAVTEWETFVEPFVDAQGEELSDHQPVMARFEWGLP